MRQTLRSIAERLDKYARSVSFFASQQATGATAAATGAAAAATSATTGATTGATTTGATTSATTGATTSAATLAGVSPKEDKRTLAFFGGIYSTIRIEYV